MRWQWLTKLAKAISFCADILPIIARDYVAILGSPHLRYSVLIGRRDTSIASNDAANTNLPKRFC